MYSGAVFKCTNCTWSMAIGHMQSDVLHSSIILSLHCIDRKNDRRVPSTFCFFCFTTLPFFFSPNFQFLHWEYSFVYLSFFLDVGRTKFIHSNYHRLMSTLRIEQYAQNNLISICQNKANSLSFRGILIFSGKKYCGIFLRQALFSPIECQALDSENLPMFSPPSFLIQCYLHCSIGILIDKFV